MSLIIAIHVSDGLVMASDSRITYSTTSTTSEGNISTEVGVHITDTTPKTFVSPNRVGISYCGDSTIKNKPITGFVESFIEEHKDGKGRGTGTCPKPKNQEFTKYTLNCSLMAA